MEQPTLEVQGEVVAEITKNEREVIRFTLEDYKGHAVVGARVWAKLTDGRLVPTKKGITFVRELYQPFMEAMYQVGLKIKAGQSGSGQSH